MLSGSDVRATRARLYFTEGSPTAAVPWAIPQLAAVAKIDTITGTVPRPEVAWGLDLGGIPTDAVRVQLGYQVSDPAPATGATHAAHWTLYVASASTGVARFPEIPVTFQGFTPESTSLDVVAEQLDVPGKASLIAAVNSEFDRIDIAFSSRVFVIPAM